MATSRRGWVAIALAGAALIVLPFDASLSAAFQLDDIPGDLRRILKLSELFAHGFGVAVALMLIWTLTPEKRRTLPRVAACAVLPGLAANLVKLAVGRFRPNAAADFGMGDATWIGLVPTWGDRLAMESGYAIQSFPSAHTATAMGLAIGLGWLLPRGRWVFMGLAMLAMLQRIESQAHWPSDVLVGAAMAVAIASWLTLHESTADRWFAQIEGKPNAIEPLPVKHRAA